MTGAQAELVLVAAVARNRVIGRDGQLPWSIPHDLRHFRQVTLGGAVIMGRVTYASIGRPLSGRRNVVLSSDPDFYAPDTIRASSTDEALRRAAASHEGAARGVFVIGGSSVYEQFLPVATGLELTLVERTPAGDTWFPTFVGDEWQCVSHTYHEGDPGYSFHTLDRVAAGTGQSACVAALTSPVRSSGKRNPQDQVLRL